MVPIIHTFSILLTKTQHLRYWKKQIVGGFNALALLSNRIRGYGVIVCSKTTNGSLWNQCLVNLDFDDNKIKFKTNDYISSVIRQDDFQSGNHKDKSSQREIIKKKTSIKSVFQDPSFIRSLCKVVGALGISCITFFTYTPKSSKSFFILNPLKLDHFIFSTKILCQMFFKFV